MQSYLVFTWKLAIPVNLSGDSLIKSSVDVMHLDFGDLAAGGFATLAA